MDIQGKNYKIKFDNNKILVMSGKLAAMPEEYEEIEKFFGKIINAVSKSSEFILNLRDLTFLNSSGIKSICVSLVMEADDIEGLHMKILCSNSLTWQIETIPTFKGLMENLEIIFE